MASPPHPCSERPAGQRAAPRAPNQQPPPHQRLPWAWVLPPRPAVREQRGTRTTTASREWAPRHRAVHEVERKRSFRETLVDQRRQPRWAPSITPARRVAPRDDAAAKICDRRPPPEPAMPPGTSSSAAMVGRLLRHHCCCQCYVARYHYRHYHRERRRREIPQQRLWWRRLRCRLRTGIQRPPHPRV